MGNIGEIKTNKDKNPVKKSATVNSNRDYSGFLFCPYCNSAVAKLVLNQFCPVCGKRFCAGCGE